jgi:hypothetical protein
VTDDIIKQLGLPDLEQLRHGTFKTVPNDKRRDSTKKGKEEPIPRPPQTGGLVPASPLPASDADTPEKDGGGS